ncbi:MAG: hypothetical protein V1806_18215 [Pseudomonadota bacterium]
MSGHGEKLSRKQEAAIIALLTTGTIGEAARVAGVDAATLGRWLKAPAFADAYRSARREALSLATSRLQQVAGEAVDSLATVMNDQASPASARVSAARSVLNLAYRAQEQQDFEARLSALEARTENDKCES